MAGIRGEQKQSHVFEARKTQAKRFPITNLPIELQLHILSYVLAHGKPIVLSGFTSTPSFAQRCNPNRRESTSTPAAKRWNHLPFSIMLASQHMHDLSLSLLFSSQINTFMFTTPPCRQWSYARDWYWTFSFMIDHLKGTAAAMQSISRVIFKCDGSMDNSLIGTAVDNLPSMVMLTVDFKEFWGSPSAKLEEEGRLDSGLGGFGGHVVLSDRIQARTPVYSAVEGIGDVVVVSSPTTTHNVDSEVSDRNHSAWIANDSSGDIGKEGFVSMVWHNVVVTSDKRVLKELRFSGLKIGKGNWDEVVAYGERVSKCKGIVEVD